MSRQSSALSTVQVQGAEFVNDRDYIDHPDLRLVAAFFLGWVFFSGLRHVWFSAFLRELMRICKAIIDRRRDRPEPVTSTGSLHEQSARTQRSSSSVEKMYRRKQRDAPVLLLCMAFMLASLSSFLSLLTFDPNAGQAACAFVVTATAVSSQAARVCGFLILGLDMRGHVRRPWELHIFCVLLGIGTVLSGVTAVVGPGQLTRPFLLPNLALCSRKRFLPTSLASSILNFVLELYIIIRSLSLIQPPRLRPSLVQNARIIHAGSLLLFDLLVVVPNTIFTNFVAEFVPFSIGALGVLAAFNSSFGLTDAVPTRLDVPTSRSYRPSSAVRASEVSIRRDMSERVMRIDNNPISAIPGLSQDIEADTSPSPSPRATPGHSVAHLGDLHDETIPTPSPQPYVISVPTTMDILSPGAQLEPGNGLRREKILSYSSPVWDTFGPPGDESSGSASSHSHISIEITMSPTSDDHSHKRDNKVLSASSTILGSDIIRNATSNKGKDRMRIRHSIPPPLPLSTTSSVFSSSRLVTHQSWASRASAYPTTSEDAQPGSALPRGRSQYSRPTSSLSSKSKLGSKSKLSSKSSSSIRSAKTAVIKLAEGSPSGPAWIGLPMGPARPSRPFSSSPRGRVGIVRGPRPPPSAMQIQSLVMESGVSNPT